MTAGTADDWAEGRNFQVVPPLSDEQRSALKADTTAVACRELGRRFVGCDVDPVAVDVARQRLTEEMS